MLLRRILNCTSLAWFVLIILYLLQSGLVNYYIIFYIPDHKILWLTIIPDAIIFLLMLCSFNLETAADKSAVQWVMHSINWAGKVLLIQLVVSNELRESKFFGPTTLAMAYLLSPIVYILLMFRSSKQLFGTISKKITVESVLHVDMLWHVVIDLIDVIYMLRYSRPADLPFLTNSFCNCIIEKRGVDTFFDLKDMNCSDNFKFFQQLTILFAFIAILAHSQSFPGVEIVRPLWSRIPGRRIRQLLRATNLEKHFESEMEDAIQYSDIMSESGSEDLQMADAPALDASHGHDPDRQWNTPPVSYVCRRSWQVIVARKRSALVSILVVDLPFLALRFYLFIITSFTGHPEISPFMLKNGVCAILQLMQLRLVKRAERDIQHKNIQLEVYLRELYLFLYNNVKPDELLPKSFFKRQQHKIVQWWYHDYPSSRKTSGRFFKCFSSVALMHVMMLSIGTIVGYICTRHNWDSINVAAVSKLIEHNKCDLSQ